MSWKNLDLEHIRMEFVMLAKEEGINISELCRLFHISRKTGYKWLKRYLEEGLSGIAERSRRPLTIKREISGEVVMKIVEIRHQHPTWGPKKIKEIIRRSRETNIVPSVSSIARILKRLDLTEPKGRGRKKSVPRQKAISKPDGCNSIWTIDFKGWWRLGSGEICEPLTIRDLYSRYVLCVKPMKKKGTFEVENVFREMFSRYGMPDKIRSDNGVPFASVRSPIGLSRLSAWWRTLGIEHERTRPGHPEENGSHERFHGDIAKEIESSPSKDFETESKRLEKWRQEYNYVRPNEAIDQKVPGEVYKRSKRKFRKINFAVYPSEFKTETVKKNGCILFDGKYVYLSTVFRDLDIGLEKTVEGQTNIWFCDLLIGTLSMNGDLILIG